MNDNLLGDERFCPMVRRTPALKAFEGKNLPEKCQAVLAEYPREILKRALSYLYTKETKSSFEIENVRLDTSRTERFVRLLVLAEKKDFFSKQDLIDLQNRIVDERFRDQDYRQNQNYVGESIGMGRQRVHCVSPKPADLPGLMEGMFVAHQRMTAGGVHPVVGAAAVAFGFVFLHPFGDGERAHSPFSDPHHPGTPEVHAIRGDFPRVGGDASRSRGLRQRVGIVFPGVDASGRSTILTIRAA